jgi:hypothetical protein
VARYRKIAWSQRAGRATNSSGFISVNGAVRERRQDRADEPHVVVEGKPRHAAVLVSTLLWVAFQDSIADGALRSRGVDGE